jgi:flagellar basal body rod protein FlgF
MGENLKDIKETAANVAQILRHVSSPELQASLDKIKHTSNDTKEIMELLREPRIVKNLENIRLTAEAFQSVSSKFESSIIELKNTEIFDDIKKTLKISNNKLSSSSYNESLVEAIKSISEMVTSMRQLIDELRLTVAHSKTSGLVNAVNHTLQNVSDAYTDINTKS